MVGKVPVPDPVTAMMARKIGANGGLPYRWNPKYPARIGVMPREGGYGDVRWFEVEPCYVFHPLNAYDDGDSIVLDVVRHPQMFDRELHGPDEGGPTLDRWTVDLAAGKVLEERLDDRGQEFPRVDERLVGRRHRYGYAMSADGGADPGGSLYKHDFHTGHARNAPSAPGRQPGEFVFVPSRGDAAEDDGVLMGFVFDPATSEATSRCSTPPRWRRSPRSTCRTGCPTASTATGSRRPDRLLGPVERDAPRRERRGTPVLKEL